MPYIRPFGEAGEVRLTETEFEIVDACLDGFLIHTVFHDILEGAADDGQEFFFLIFIGVLGYDGEEWLQDAVLVRSRKHLFRCVRQGVPV